MYTYAYKHRAEEELADYTVLRLCTCMCMCTCAAYLHICRCLYTRVYVCDMSSYVPKCASVDVCVRGQGGGGAGRSGSHVDTACIPLDLRILSTPVCKYIDIFV